MNLSIRILVIALTALGCASTRDRIPLTANSRSRANYVSRAEYLRYVGTIKPPKSLEMQNLTACVLYEVQPLAELEVNELPTAPELSEALVGERGPCAEEAKMVQYDMGRSSNWHQGWEEDARFALRQILDEYSVSILTTRKMIRSGTTPAEIQDLVEEKRKEAAERAAKSDSEPSKK